MFQTNLIMGNCK